MHLLQNFQRIKSTSWYLDGSLMASTKQIIQENYHHNHLKTLFPSNLYLHLNISSLPHHIYDLKPLITNCHIKFINIINFINIYIVVFKKNKIKTPGDKNLDDMIYHSWDIECDRLKLVITGHFLPFYPPLS